MNFLNNSDFVRMTTIPGNPLVTEILRVKVPNFAQLFLEALVFQGSITTKKMIWLLLIFVVPECLSEYYINIPESYSYWNLCDDKIGIFRQAPSPHFTTTRKEINQYSLVIQIPPKTVTVLVKFSSEATVELPIYTNKAKVSLQELARPKNSYSLTFFGNFDAPEITLQVSPPDPGAIPYVVSVLRDYEELCKNPRTGYLDETIKQGATNRFNPFVDESCGRRKVSHTQLIVHGESTKSGDWPWHVAILRLEKSSPKYICGGTLLTTTLVLTAAHCASIRSDPVVPEILSVHLGKHNLIGGDIGTEERLVFRVILHPKYNGLTQDNDIALLKLKSEAVFTDYIQPACLWAANMLPNSKHLFGTVVGWGFNHQDSLSPTLQKATIPIIPDLVCYKSNPTFFHRKLDENKFCAGFGNGTSVCNGDSGGGLMIFVPDSSANINADSGAWYVRGIVSIAPRLSDAAVCDPYEYTIFTDVEKYRDWLLQYME